MVPLVPYGIRMGRVQGMVPLVPLWHRNGTSAEYPEQSPGGPVSQPHRRWPGLHGFAFAALSGYCRCGDNLKQSRAEYQGQQTEQNTTMLDWYLSSVKASCVA